MGPTAFDTSCGFGSLQLLRLTTPVLSLCLRVSPEIVVRIVYTPDNNLGIESDFTNFLKGSCC